LWTGIAGLKISMKFCILRKAEWAGFVP